MGGRELLITISFWIAFFLFFRLYDLLYDLIIEIVLLKVQKIKNVNFKKTKGIIISKKKKPILMQKNKEKNIKLGKEIKEEVLLSEEKIGGINNEIYDIKKFYSMVNNNEIGNIENNKKEINYDKNIFKNKKEINYDKNIFKNKKEINYAI